MTKTELIEIVSARAELTKAEAHAAVNATLDAIIEGIVKEGKVILPGFGTFETRTRSARTAINLQTKQPIKVPAKKAPAFKPGKAMKDAVEKK
ncbi:MAG: HU family DNA-binding protein [Clostridia bacterium]|nr:HU family DNA-binding protein [Clostridia bacterium]